MGLEPATLLLVILVVPAAAAVVVALAGRENGPLVRWISLTAVLANFILTAMLIAQVAPELASRQPDPEATDAVFKPEYVTRFELMPLTGASGTGPQFYVGIDGLNLWLIALTSFLMLPSVLISWASIKDRVNEFYAWLLLLQTAMTGVFVAFDLILFYVFFELTLVPLFFMIGIWGGPMRREAARKFFLFTLFGSLITLLGMIGIVIAVRSATHQLTFSIPDLVEQVQAQLRVSDVDAASHWRTVQMFAFLALTAGFAVKVPLFPVHTWLPLAHTEAPTAGSVLLAGVLLKLGTYGFLRLALPLTPDAALSVGVPLLGTLAAIGIIYGALCAFAQQDVKKMVAYSSVSHMGFCVIGLFALNAAGLSGGLLQMINHGVSTGGLFLVVGMLYERYHTRMIPDYGGMAARLKVMAACWVFICLSSIGFPFLNGFIGEMLILAGVYNMPGGRGAVLAVVVSCGIFLGGWYLFTMLRNIFFGPLREPHHDGEHVVDVTPREWAILIPVAAACIFLGVAPQPVLNVVRRDVNSVVRVADAARERAAVVKVATATNER